MCTATPRPPSTLPRHYPCKPHGFFKNTKHILRAAAFLRDLVARLVIVLEHVPGKVMIADVLTKAVARPLYLELLRLLAEYPQSGLAVVVSEPRA